MAEQQLSMFGGTDAVSGEKVKTASFTLSRTLRADPQRSIDQWLITVFIGEWMFGKHAGDEAVLDLNNTVRQGGEYCYETRRAGQQVSHSGSFLELRIPGRLVCSWQQSDEPDLEMRLAVDFEAVDDKTRMRLQCTLPAAFESRLEEFKSRWIARCDALSTRLKGA